MAVGVGLAILVGCSSPTTGTFLFLGGALFVLGLLLFLGRLAVNMRRLSLRVHPGIATTAITLSCFVALSELALRFFMHRTIPNCPPIGGRESLGYQYDSTLGWIPRANSQRTIQFGSHTVSVANNSYGFRDPEPAFDSRPSVVFLGDSFTWGVEVEANERFTEKLREQHPEWRVFNFGVAGYGTDQEYLLLQRHFQVYHPRMVFLVFCTENDFTDNTAKGESFRAFKPFFTEEPEGLKLHNVPVPLSDQVFCSEHPLVSRLHLTRLAMRAWANTRSSTPLFNKEITFALLRALKNYVTDGGAVFRVGFTRRDADLEHFLESLEIPHVDLSTDLRTDGVGHWSAAGHTFVAEKVDQFLRSDGRFDAKE